MIKLEVTVCENECEARENLRAGFVERLERAIEGIASLRQLVRDLVGRGIARRELVQWGVEAGYSTGYVRSLLSRIFKDLGLHCRKPGAGRKSPPEALALRALARKHYGERARKFLLAAYRADEAELSKAPCHRPAKRGNPMDELLLGKTRLLCDTNSFSN